MCETITPSARIPAAGAVLVGCGVGLFSGAAAGLNIGTFATLLAGGSAVVCYRGGESPRRRRLAISCADRAVCGDVCVARFRRFPRTCRRGDGVRVPAPASVIPGETSCRVQPVRSNDRTRHRAVASLFTTTPSILRREIPRGEFNRGRAAVLCALARGVTGFIPLALLFGALLVSADARFETFAYRVFDLDLALLFRRLALFAVCLSIAVTVIAATVLQPAAGEREIPVAGGRAGAIEVTPMLAGLSLLSASVRRPR